MFRTPLCRIQMCIHVSVACSDDNPELWQWPPSTADRFSQAKRICLGRAQTKKCTTDHLVWSEDFVEKLKLCLSMQLLLLLLLLLILLLLLPSKLQLDVRITLLLIQGHRAVQNFLNMNRPEHHGTDRLKERERKRPTFHPPRLRTICVQPDKYWNCVEGKIGETAERWGRAGMDLSKCYNAILN